MTLTYPYLLARAAEWCADQDALLRWAASHEMVAGGPGKSEPRDSYLVNGVACIMLTGPLVKSALPAERAIGIGDYVGLADSLSAAIATPGLKGICLYVDSPGGSFSGLPEAVDAVAAAAKRTQVEAVIDGMAASAAYWLCSPAAKITASKSAQAGSIGAIVTHVSMSRALAAQGMDVTVVADGADKASGHPFRQLGEADAKGLQARVAEYAGQFRDSVKTFRPNVSPDALTGKVFSAANAKKLGLIDEVGGTIGDAIRRMSAGPGPQAAAAVDFASACRAEFQHTGSKAAAIAAVCKKHPEAHAAWLKSGQTGQPIF